jgi:hypothetical protein
MDPMEMEYMMILPHLMNVYGQHACSINIPADVIERCDSSFDIRNYSQFSLIRAILAIRACGGRYKRAYKTLEEIGIPVPIVVYVVKKICKILGCGNLDTNISSNDTIRAYDQFLHLQHPDTPYGQGNPHQWPSPSHNSSLDYMPPSPHFNPNSSSQSLQGYYDDYDSQVAPPHSPMHSHNNSFHLPNHGSSNRFPPHNPNDMHSMGLNPNAAAFSYPSPYEQGRHHEPQYYPRDDMHPGPPPPHHHHHPAGGNFLPPELPPELSYDRELLPSNIFMPETPVDIHKYILQLLLPEVNLDVLLEQDPAAAANKKSSSRQQSIAFQSVDLQSLSQLFWILSICVFITVCDDRQPIEESLARLHELCKFVGSGNSDLLTMSPVLGVALDVIVQRAVYELSDKVSLLPSKEIPPAASVVTPPPGTTTSESTSPMTESSPMSANDGYSNPDQLYESIHSTSDHAADLYRCISLMLYSVTDSCVRIESGFLPSNGNGGTGGYGGQSSAYDAERPSSAIPTPPLSRSSSIKGSALEAMASSTASMTASLNPAQTQTSMNSRTQKLAKQLREALAWSSCRDQLPAESQVAFLKQCAILSGENDQTANPSAHENLISKYQQADQILMSTIHASSLRNQEYFYQDTESMRNRLFSVFYHLSSSTNDFVDTAVDYGGLSGTALLPHLIQLASLSSPLASNNNSKSSSNLNQLRSNNILSQPPVGAYGSAYGDVEYTLNIPSFTNKIQSFQSQILNIQNKLNLYHDILRIDSTIENCLKHIKACIKEARNQMNIYWNDLQSYTQIYLKKYHASANQHPYYRGSGPNPGMNPSAMDMTSKIAKIRAEMESLCTIGDKLISIMGNNLRALRSTGVPAASASRGSASTPPYDMNSLPILSNDFETLAKLPSLLQARRFLMDEISKLSDQETNELKRYLKQLETLLREPALQFPSVKLVVRPKHPGIRYGPFYPSSNNPGNATPNGSALARTVTPPYVQSSMLGNASPGQPLSRSNTPQVLSWAYLITINDSGVLDPYLQLAGLYNTYLNYEKSSARLRVYFSCILQFAKSHSLADPDAGTLSIEAWLVLGLHVLLYYDIIPNLHSTPTTLETSFMGLESNSEASSDKVEGSPPRQIDDYSIIALLELFFRYFTEEFDVLGSIISIRGKGEYILPKNSWRIDPPILWRFCIEDPFEKCVDNISKPYDLGSTLTRPGQIQVFKAIRRAAFGIHAIIVRDAADMEKYIRMLFHKDDLLALSRMAGYNGAAVIATPLYQPPVNWKSKILYTWTTDKSLQTVDALASSSGVITRQSSHRELISSRQNSIRLQNASRQSSGHSLLDELLIESFGMSIGNRRQSVTTSAANSFSSTHIRPASSQPGIVDEGTIRFVDAEYVDSDDEESSAPANPPTPVMQARAPPSIIVPPPPPAQNMFSMSGTSPTHYQQQQQQQQQQFMNYSSTSLGSIHDIQNLSPQRRPPPNPATSNTYRSPRIRNTSGRGGVAGPPMMYQGPYPSPANPGGYEPQSPYGHYPPEYEQQQAPPPWRQPQSRNQHSPMRDHYDNSYSPAQPPPQQRAPLPPSHRQPAPTTPTSYTRRPSYGSSGFDALSYPSPGGYQPPFPSPAPYNHPPPSPSPHTQGRYSPQSQLHQQQQQQSFMQQQQSSEYDRILDQLGSDSFTISPSRHRTPESSFFQEENSLASTFSFHNNNPSAAQSPGLNDYSFETAASFDSPMSRSRHERSSMNSPIIGNPNPSSSSLTNSYSYQQLGSSLYEPSSNSNYFASPEIDPTVAAMQGLEEDPTNSFVGGMSDRLHAWLTESVASMLPEGLIDSNSPLNSSTNSSNANNNDRKQLFK